MSQIKLDLQYICNYLFPRYKLYKIEDKFFIQLTLSDSANYMVGPLPLWDDIKKYISPTRANNNKLNNHIYRACRLSKIKTRAF